MPHLVPLVLALLTLADNPPSPQPPSPSPLELVTAFETVLADAIARAEPSVVAIARDKDGKDEATTAVRGGGPRRRPCPTSPRFNGLRGFETPRSPTTSPPTTARAS